MWFIKRMLRVSWTEKKTNDAVLDDAGVQRSLIKTIRKRQLQFLGHLNRHKGLEHLVLTGKIEGKRSPGRQRTRYVNSLNKWTTKNIYNDISFPRVSEDRDEWRSMITDVCIRPGT